MTPKEIGKKCSYGFILDRHCSGCTDPHSEGTHQGCTIEHGHIGCSLHKPKDSGWPKDSRWPDYKENILRDNNDGTCNCKPLGNGCFFTNHLGGLCDCKCHSSNNSDWEKKWFDYVQENAGVPEEIEQCTGDAYVQGYFAAMELAEKFFSQTISEAVSQREGEIVEGIKNLKLSSYNGDIYRNGQEDMQTLVLSIINKPK